MLVCTSKLDAAHTLVIPTRRQPSSDNFVGMSGAKAPTGVAS